MSQRGSDRFISTQRKYWVSQDGFACLLSFSDRPWSAQLFAWHVNGSRNIFVACGASHSETDITLLSSRVSVRLLHLFNATFYDAIYQCTECESQGSSSAVSVLLQFVFGVAHHLHSLDPIVHHRSLLTLEMCDSLAPVVRESNFNLHDSFICLPPPRRSEIKSMMDNNDLPSPLLLSLSFSL